MTFYLITGPPAAGKTTWVKNKARPGDITIDFDAIVTTLTPKHTPYDPPQHIVRVAAAARQAAINTAYQLSRYHDVYAIHSMPSSKQLANYRRLGAQIVSIDPGYETCMERARMDSRPERSFHLIKQWYEGHTPGQPYKQADW